jgi:hypothetical protein
MQGSFGTPSWALTMSGYSTPAAFLLALCLTYGNLEAVWFCPARDMNEQDGLDVWFQRVSTLHVSLALITSTHWTDWRLRNFDPRIQYSVETYEVVRDSNSSKHCHGHGDFHWGLFVSNLSVAKKQYLGYSWISWVTISHYISLYYDILWLYYDYIMTMFFPALNPLEPVFISGWRNPPSCYTSPAPSVPAAQLSS